MIFLGIDPGSLVTGYGFIRVLGSRIQMVDAGAIRLPAKAEFGTRLLKLATRLEELITEHQPQALAIEKVFHGINVSSTLKLGYVRGVVLLTAARLSIPLAEYSPTEIKKTVTGYGRAEKSQIQEMVRILLNLREVPSPHDVADALAIAICHAHTAPVLERYRRA